MGNKLAGAGSIINEEMTANQIILKITTGYDCDALQHVRRPSLLAPFIRLSFTVSSLLFGAIVAFR